MTISYEKLVLLNQGRYQTQDYLSFSFQNLSKYIPLKTLHCTKTEAFH